QAAGDREAMAHIGFGLVAVERRQVIARGDALGELAQFRLGEDLAQLGLAQKYNLQQFLRRRFEGRQEAQLFERVGREVLRLVDDQHDAQALRIGVEQIGVQRVDEALEAAAARLDVELQLLADRLEQLYGRQLRVQHERDARVLRQLFEQQ